MEPPITWQLLAKHFAHETSAEENWHIEAWVAEDASHAHIFQQARQAWQQPYTRNAAFDINRGTKLLDTKLKQIHINPSKSQPVYRIPLLARWAAMLVLTLGLGTLAYMAARDFTFQPAIEYVELKNPAGKRATISLPDGSKVYLNAESALKYPKQFSGGIREVFLSGEAFFEVHHNPDKPFLVQSGPVTTRVVGTSFNVKTYPSDSSLQVTVVSGLVQVQETHSPEQKQVQLSHNQQAAWSANSRLQKLQVHAASLIAWKEGILRFDDTPLPEVTRQLERWYGVKITFENKAINTCLLTAQFRNESLEVVLESISLSTGIAYAQQGKNISFTGKGCQ